MSILFSPSKQTFYDTIFTYKDLPEDAVALSVEKYKELLSYRSKGCIINSDLSPSLPPPSPFHKFIDGVWIDNRTIVEKRQQYLQTLKPLTRRQFKLILMENNLLEQVEMVINSIPDATLRMRAKIEYEDAVSFERLNPTLAQLYKLMGLKESQVDALWEDGLKL